MTFTFSVLVQRTDIDACPHVLWTAVLTGWCPPCCCLAPLQHSVWFYFIRNAVAAVSNMQWHPGPSCILIQCSVILLTLPGAELQLPNTRIALLPNPLTRALATELEMIPVSAFRFMKQQQRPKCHLTKYKRKIQNTSQYSSISVFSTRCDLLTLNPTWSDSSCPLVQERNQTAAYQFFSRHREPFRWLGHPR